MWRQSKCGSVTDCTMASQRAILAIALVAMMAVAALGADELAEEAQRKKEKTISKCQKEWRERHRILESPDEEDDEDRVLLQRIGRPFALGREGPDFVFENVPALGRFTQEELDKFMATDCDVTTDKTALFFALRMAQQSLVKDMTDGGIYDNMRRVVEALGPAVDGKALGPIEYYGASQKLDILYNKMLEWWENLSKGRAQQTNSRGYVLISTPDDVFSAMTNLRWLVDKDTNGFIKGLTPPKTESEFNTQWLEECNQYTTAHECLQHSGQHEVNLVEESDREGDSSLPRRLDIDGAKPGGRCIWKSTVEFNIGDMKDENTIAKFKALLRKADPEGVDENGVFTEESKMFLQQFIRPGEAKCAPCNWKDGECSQMHVNLGSKTTFNVAEGYETHCRLSNDSVKKCTSNCDKYFGVGGSDRPLREISKRWGCYKAMDEEGSPMEECCAWKSNKEIVEENMRRQHGPLPEEKKEREEKRGRPQPPVNPVFAKMEAGENMDLAVKEFTDAVESYEGKKIVVRFKEDYVNPVTEKNYWVVPKDDSAGFTFVVEGIFWSVSSKAEGTPGRRYGYSDLPIPEGGFTKDNVEKYIWMLVKNTRGNTWSFPMDAVDEITMPIHKGVDE